MIWLVMALVLLLSSPASAQAPVIAFMDLIEGPAKGNSDTSQGQRANVNGTIVTLWGTNLGTSQGSSTVTVGGVPASAVYYWGTATPPNCGPANLHNGYQNLQCVIFQVAGATPSGAQNVVVTVGAVASAPATFTVRSGAIYFVARSGGNFTSIQAALNFIDSACCPIPGGQVIYVKDGMGTTAGVNWPHLTTAQLSLVAYPGASVQLGDASHDAIQYNFSGSRGHTTYSKLSVFGGGPPALSAAVQLGPNGRAIGLLIQAPRGQGATAAIGGSGNNLSVGGCELTNVGDPANFDTLYHVLYFGGNRDGPPRHQSDRFILWNYFHDNSALRAINLFNATGSSPDPSDTIHGYRIINNVIVAQQGSGIALLAGTVGENWIIGNLLIRTGQGPTTQALNFVGIELRTYWPAGQTPDLTNLFHFWGNTIVNSGVSYGASRGALLLGDASVQNASQADLRGNLIYQGNGLPYLSPSSNFPSAPNVARYSNNLWFGAGRAPSWDTNSVNADPLLVSTSGAGDYRLQAGSPAIGTGATINYATTDLDGNVRPMTAPWDIGAYQLSRPKGVVR